MNIEEKTIIENNFKKYFGEMIHEWSSIHKNEYVVTGMQQGKNDISNRIGRVVQIRLEAG